MKKQVIAVVGATGAQGGGLVRAILEDPEQHFLARALTRKPDSDKGRRLAQAGAEVVAADIDDVESLKRAFDGAHGVYCVTFFWDHFSPEKELAQARGMAEAARAAGVGHVLWSTLEDTRKYVPLDDGRMPTLLGRYKVPHFDAKGEANQAFLDSGVPATLFHTSFYWENILASVPPRRGADGKLVFQLPLGDRKLPGIAVDDIGGCALGVFAHGDEFAGKSVGVAGEHLTGAAMATELGRALGEEVTYAAVPFDVFRGLGFPGAEDMGNMFQFKHDFEREFCGLRDVGLSRRLHPGLKTFAAWLGINGSRIPRA